jgi:hypothetical protein
VVRAFRNRVEEAVLEVHGRIGPYHASVIATAAVALGQWKRMERVQNTEDLSMEHQLAVSDRIVKHKEAVDRALAKLGLDQDGKADPWDTYYQQAAASGLQNAQAVPGQPPAALDGSKTTEPAPRVGGPGGG